MPELVLADLEGAPWLGLLCETDSTGIARWIYAPLTSVEERALLVGAVEIWECFRKPEVLLVDESEAEDIVVALDGLAVPQEALPRRGFVLPTWARPEVPQEATVPRLSLARNSARAGIGLKTLSVISDRVQRLYTALVQQAMDRTVTVVGSVSAKVRQAAELEVEAMQPGSLLINLKPYNISQFEKASSTIDALLRAGDAHALAALLRELGGRVQSRYEDLLDELVTHDLALMISWGTQQHTFVAAHTAVRRMEALPVSAESADDTWLAQGVLLGLDPGARTFTFYESRTDEEITGQFADTFEAPAQIAVGPSSPLHIVRLGRSKLATRGGQVVTRHRLLEILRDLEDGTRTATPSASTSTSV